MQKKYISIITILFILFVMHTTIANNIPINANVIASVNVYCPFAINLNLIGNYVIYRSNSKFNYNIKTVAPCSISDAKGNFLIENISNNKIVLNKLINNFIITNTIENHTLSVNTNTLTLGKYYSNLKIYGGNTYNTINISFNILAKPELKLISISLIKQLFQNSIQNIKINYRNIGNFAALNISMHLHIVGPKQFNIIYNNKNLTPKTNQLIALNLPINITTYIGNYTAYINFTYMFNGIIHTSQSINESYKVTRIPSSQLHQNITIINIHSNNSTISPIIIPKLNLTSAPLYISLLSNSSTMSEIDLHNNNNFIETIILNTTKYFSNLISFSTDYITLNPNQSRNIQIYIHSNSSIATSTYIIPILMNVKFKGISKIYKKFVVLSLIKHSFNSSTITNKINLINNSNNAEGTVEISAPLNAPILNKTLDTILPFNVVKNISEIYAYGLPNKILKTYQGYDIRWTIAYLPAGNKIIGYYKIKNLNRRSNLVNIQNIFSSTTLPTSKNILNIINISIPTFYTNSINNITVKMLYTGSSIQHIILSLSGPSQYFIINRFQNINASPNQFIKSKFKIKTSNFTGTLLFNLNIKTKGVKLNYSIPVIVIQKFINTKNKIIIQQVHKKSEFNFASIKNTINLNKFRVTLILILIIIFVYMLLKSKFAKSQYNEERAKKLIEIKKQIKRN